MSKEFFAECLCLAPGHECHGCKVNAYIYALKDRAEAAEAKLEAMRVIERGWDQCDYDEQDCLSLILRVLHGGEE